MVQKQKPCRTKILKDTCRAWGSSYGSIALTPVISQKSTKVG